ncbi:hypothetical protein GCM10011392_14510 [Wenxinia marina]|nr:hypothetical protein GCM10011392_14510 [Wenxinia marina]
MSCLFFSGPRDRITRQPVIVNPRVDDPPLRADGPVVAEWDAPVIGCARVDAIAPFPRTQPPIRRGAPGAHPADRIPPLIEP